MSEAAKHTPADWLRDYAHDLMEDGNLDHEAARLEWAADAFDAQERLIDTLTADGQFLLDRLEDFGIPDEEANSWLGHVEPAIARFRTTLAGCVNLPARQNGEPGNDEDGEPLERDGEE